MRRRFSRSVPALLALTLVASQCPSALAAPNGAGSDTATAVAHEDVPSDAQSNKTTDSQLSEEQRKELAERERKNGAMEDYEGGLVIEVGAGVIILALVLIIVFVD